MSKPCPAIEWRVCLLVVFGAIGACDHTSSAPAARPAELATSSVSSHSPLPAPRPSATAAAPTTPASGPATLLPNPDIIAARPYKLGIPPGLQAGKPQPLVLFLHGYGATGQVFERVLDVPAIARTLHFVYAIPDGTTDSHKMRFWNATDACCDFDGSKPDDVAYLRAVLADAVSRASIDRNRVFVVGFSNGGFMAHRLACEMSESIAGIASVAGAAPNDPSRCTPTSPVTVLQMHGDADPVVRYEGGHVLDKQQMPAHPGARETVAGWARRNRCAGVLLPGTSIDLEDKLDGPETVTVHFEGCQDSAVELWTVRGGNHFIGQKARAIEAAITFLLSHPKR